MKYFNIPIFVPHLGCPFDCVFCNQRKITGAAGNVSEETVVNTVEEHLKYLPESDCEIEIAFFGGSFTGIDSALQERLLSAAYSYVGKHNISGIRVSTRPDYIDDTVISRLNKYRVTTVELGVQSMDEEVLKCSARGHTPHQVEEAASLIKKGGIRLGLQMMTGLPADTAEKSIQTAKKIIELKPEIVRIYPTLVIKDTMLEKMYRDGKYTPMSVEDAVSLCSRLYKMFTDAGITVIRVGLQNTDEISPGGAVVAGPFHSAFGELVDSELFYNKICESIKAIQGDFAEVYVNPHDISKAAGHKKCNIEKIFKNYQKKISVKPDGSLPKGEIRIQGR